MVTVRIIDEIIRIVNADSIDIARVGGWNVIVRRGEFTSGDKVLFFEIDTLLNQNIPQFAEFARHGVKSVDVGDTTIYGHVLRTMKMRGVYSQGLILPLHAFGLDSSISQDELDEFFADKAVKFEEAIPDDNNIIGSFPPTIRSTGAERVQNLTDAFIATLDPSQWIATEKVDGASTTIFRVNGELRFAGRNWEIIPSEKHKSAIIDTGIGELIGEGEWAQGELLGGGINGNKLKVDKPQFLVFHASSPEVKQRLSKYSVPTLDITLATTVEGLISQAEGLKSSVNPKVNAEGIVWWNVNGEEFNELNNRSQFKVINNKYLVKQK